MAIKNFSDFYSMSELRDLLFHVREHRFSLPQIQKTLTDLGLKFCGFDTLKIIHHFKLRHAGPNDPYDLEKWASYEKLYPKAFSSMYQFWIQKIVN